jgi:hypothetical protein
VVDEQSAGQEVGVSPELHWPSPHSLALQPPHEVAHSPTHCGSHATSQQ